MKSPFILSILLVVLTFFVKRSVGKPLEFDESHKQNDFGEFEDQGDDLIVKKRFYLPEDDFLTICCCIALFIVVAVLIIFGLIFYNEAKEVKDKKKKEESNSFVRRSTSPNFYSTPGPGNGFSSRNSRNNSMEMTPSKLETIPEFQADENC